MRWSWRIGQIAGIGIYVHATFWLLILLVLYESWIGGHTRAATAAGIVFVLTIFGCIVLHELGHALAARRFGIRTHDITLLPIAGLARLEKMPDDPKQELWVALAGPAVNAIIAAAVFVIAAGLGFGIGWREFHLAGGGFLARLIEVNIWLALFNLIPAFPMDGGRVLRALLAKRMEYARATQIAARVGQGAAFIFGLVGLFTNPFLLFIALFIWLGAEQEATMVQMRSSTGGIPVQRVMLTNYRTLRPDDTVGRAVDYILAGSQEDFPVVAGDRVIGALTREDVVRGMSQGGPTVQVREIMRDSIQSVDSHDMLQQALAVLQNCKYGFLPVLHNGRLVGMLTTENVGEFLAIQAAYKASRTLSRIQRKL